MKKIVVAGAMLLAAGLLLARPGIKFKATAIDFGEVDSGKLVQVNFEFENAGNSTLRIKNLIPSCGCTTSTLEKKEYRPGEKGVVPVTFNSAGYAGKVIKTINVQTDDPDNAEILLRLTGTVVLKEFPQAELKPDKVNFEKVQVGKRISRKFTVTNSGNLDLKIIEISSSPEITIGFPQKIIHPGKACECELALTLYEKGFISNLVKIRTNDSRNPFLFIRVEAEGI